MCYSKDLSLTSFLFGITASITLITFGNEESSDTNKTIGYYYLFITLMQLVEYLIWSDIECKNGLNKFASLTGPILNHLQPLVLLIFANMYIKSNKIIDFDILLFINGLYLLYTIIKYLKYIQNKDNFCVKPNDYGHLDWTWKHDFNYTLYVIVNFINLVNYYNNINLMTSIVLSYILLIISIFKYNKNIGEIWCLMVTGIPFVNLFIQKAFNINN